MPKPLEDGKRTTAPTRTRAPAAQKDTSADVEALLKRYGITTVPRPAYEWGGFRYTNAHDAIAAAKRGEAA